MNHVFTLSTGCDSIVNLVANVFLDFDSTMYFDLSLFIFMLLFLVQNEIESFMLCELNVSAGRNL
jgi:hypothetical protein